jgi:hypothetical protein
MYCFVVEWDDNNDNGQSVVDCVLMLWIATAASAKKRPAGEEIVIVGFMIQ